MAQTAKQIDAIIKERLPGMRLSSHSSLVESASSPADAAPRAKRAPKVDVTTPSIDELRTKFLRGDSGDAALADPDDDDDAQIVLVEPDDANSDRRQRKAIVVSSTGKILGAQG
jgi:hypothetical protein